MQYYVKPRLVNYRTYVLFGSNLYRDNLKIATDDTEEELYTHYFFASVKCRLVLSLCRQNIDYLEIILFNCMTRIALLTSIFAKFKRWLRWHSVFTGFCRSKCGSPPGNKTEIEKAIVAAAINGCSYRIIKHSARVLNAANLAIAVYVRME